MEKLIIKYNRHSTLEEFRKNFNKYSENYDLSFDDISPSTLSFFDREKIKKLIGLIEKDLVLKVVVSEITRLSRNVNEIFEILDYFEKNNVNLYIENLNLNTLVNNNFDSALKIVSSILSSLKKLEMETFRKRTIEGQKKYVANGGKMGRKVGTTEDNEKFLSKEKNQKIIELLEQNKYTIREIAELTGGAFNTIIKVKRLITPNNIEENESTLFNNEEILELNEIYDYNR
jgi:DNA invertase Pin-like site-specific DNA recombinase